MYTIYRLRDSRQGSIHYIGQTRHPLLRLAQHRRCDGTNLGKDAWIQGVLQAGGEIYMDVLEVVETESKAREREAYWIQHYLYMNEALTNIVRPKRILYTKGIVPIIYPLEKGSNALHALDDFCKEWGNISRANATKRIIIAWSKARRGDQDALAAMGIMFSGVLAAPTTTETALVSPMPENKLVIRRPSNGNAKAVELDL